jgi:hypothetical protein
VADEPQAPSGGGFSLSKKYGPLPAWGWGLLGGAGIYAVWRFYKSRSSSSATTATSADTSQQVDFAPQIATLQAEIQQLQGGESTEGKGPVAPNPANPGGTNVTSSTPTGNKPPPAGAAKTMPNVVGQRANFALGELKSGYGIIATTVPVRNPRNEYVVTKQTPRAGAKVRSGTPSVLSVKVSKRAA